MVLGIIGAGELGQQIARIALNNQLFDSFVFFDDFNKHNNFGETIGKTIDVLPAYEKKIFDKLIIGIGYKHLRIRKELFGEFFNKIPFATIIDKSVIIDKTAIIKSGCIIYPGVIIDKEVLIEENSIINLGVIISHNTQLKKNIFIAPGVTIAGNVSIEGECFIGVGSTILDGISIVFDTTIGGGTTVYKSIKAAGVYYGNPLIKIEKQ
jgi:sugar O-acyltransferase (sialic acid O-acetyltransferase NeuD family)